MDAECWVTDQRGVDVAFAVSPLAANALVSEASRGFPPTLTYAHNLCEVGIHLSMGIDQRSFCSLGALEIRKARVHARAGT